MGHSFVKSFCDKTKAKETNILLHGFYASGKTTMMFQLKYHEFIQTMPLSSWYVDTIDCKDTHFTFWDLGVRVPFRSLEVHYHKKTDAVMLIVDSSHPERFKEIRDEMHGTLYTKELRNCVVAII
ncbi:hypothetical protein KUTeg_011996 [Tegillarca granosa]|uniref:Uncharacterized protein n=1 Tax=Tegillarca granosa TaxID=220873 RepID=A0ABQ9EY84_TEGGR|nr:hypothetical protein KUTeg_011996 [Tegillarca granosa]